MWPFKILAGSRAVVTQPCAENSLAQPETLTNIWSTFIPKRQLRQLQWRQMYPATKIIGDLNLSPGFVGLWTEQPQRKSGQKWLLQRRPRSGEMDYQGGAGQSRAAQLKGRGLRPNEQTHILRYSDRAPPLPQQHGHRWLHRINKGSSVSSMIYRTPVFR